jgi:hypothetical protein
MSRIPHFSDSRLTDVDEVLTYTPTVLHPPGRFLLLISVAGLVNPKAH